VNQRFWMTIVAIGTLCAANSARAERRTFAEVYEPEVNGKDVMDLLLWNQLGHKWKNSAVDDTKFRIELQYGLTDQLDMTVYQNFEQSPSTNQDLKFESTAVELRYLLAPRGEWLHFGVLAAAILGFAGLIRARTWGPILLGLTGAVCLADGLGLLGPPTIGYFMIWPDVPGFYGRAGVFAGGLMLVMLPFLAPMVRYLRTKPARA